MVIVSNLIKKACKDISRDLVDLEILETIFAFVREDVFALTVTDVGLVAD